MNDFRAFAVSLGLRLPPVITPGKWLRVPTDDHPRKRNGALKLAIGERIGWIQNHATMERPAEWRAGKDGLAGGPDLEQMRRAHQDHARMQQAATAKARTFYGTCEPLRGGHPYLDAHGLDMTGCMGLRIDGDGWLVVPAWQGSTLSSVQRIAPDGTKRFWPGAPIAGTRYIIRPKASSQVTVICEGLATGLACVAALSSAGHSARGIVMWDAGNLTKANMRLTGWLVVAADNDHGTQERLGRNPGIEAATSAAERLGAGVAYPDGISGTDWADWRREHLSSRVRRQYETVAGSQRVVDGELARLLMLRARWKAPGTIL